MILLLLMIVTIFVGSCGGGGGDGVTNNAPQVYSVTCSPPNVSKGGSTTVVCEASDPDGDTLSYDWTATKGTFSGSGSTVTWMAPNEDGTYTIRVTVTDGKGGTVDGTCGITVAASLGSINITSIPEGANVYLDGEDMGKVTPCVLSDLPPGSYTLTLTYYHYEWLEGTVTVGVEPIIYVDWTLKNAIEKTQTIQHGPGDGNDAYVFENAKDTNHGEEIYLYVGAVLAHQFYRTFIEFDIDPIPSNAVITEAYVETHYFESVPEVNTMVGIYQVKNDWEESHINWANAPTFAADPVDTVNIPAEATQDWVTWDVTGLVQGWVDGSIANYGIMLKDVDESTIKASKGFFSSHHTNFGWRPRLVVTYFNPVPSTP
jgi:hypothetical protein